MKNIIVKKGIILFCLFGLLVACKDFDEINRKPTAAGDDQVQIEYFITNSIVGAQQNPDIAERAFVLYWKAAGHMDRINSLPIGSTDDSWTSAYFNGAAKWLGNAYNAVQVAEKREQSGTVEPKTTNFGLLQIARIWRAYLMSEFSDLFGPMPINGFGGVNPDFNKVEEVYDFILKELADATTKIKEAKIENPLKDGDPAYAFKFDKWLKFGNSLRMRLAMRISHVDEARAKTEFESAVKDNLFIATSADNFQVKEKPGWDDLTGVMSREWNMQWMSTTINNLFIGLGGISTASQVADDPKAIANIKPENWMGIKYDKHFTTKTNDPSAGYWFNGLHAKIDPRAYKAFIIPGQFDNPEYNKYPLWAPDNTGKTERALLKDNKKDTLVLIDAAYCWNAAVGGSWDLKGTLNKVIDWPGCMPRLANKFRNSESTRIFFASWESYFLIAEAALKRWKVPMTAKTAYEKGIQESFNYWGVSSNFADYITSENYSRTGTSVKWEHTTEPTSITMQYKDGYTNETKTVQYKYPTNHLYKNGTVKNDQLTKIITQKFLAQIPWLPLETWSDHRRLGLPFFENPAIEKPLEQLPSLTEANYMESKWEFFPKRIPYPTFLKNNVPDGYQQAIGLLGGEDKVSIPLWWAKH